MDTLNFRGNLAVTAMVEAIVDTINEGNFTEAEALTYLQLEIKRPCELDIKACPMDVEFVGKQIDRGGELKYTHFGYLIVSADTSSVVFLLPDDETEYTKQRLADYFLENLKGKGRNGRSFDADGDWSVFNLEAASEPCFVTENFIVSACAVEGANILRFSEIKDDDNLKAFLHFIGKEWRTSPNRTVVKESRFFDTVTVQTCPLYDGGRAESRIYKVLKPAAPLYPYLKDLADKTEESYANFLVNASYGTQKPYDL